MSDYRKIIDEIRAGKVRNVYLLGGENPYFARKIEAALPDAVVPEAARSFDMAVLYGGEVKVEDVVGQAMGFPMMAERRLVIVREAQALFKQAAAQNALVEFLNNPPENSVVCIRFNDKLPAKIKKAAGKSENIVVFESKRIYDNQLPGLIREIFADFDLHPDPRALQMLAEATGTDLLRVEKEAEKYALFFAPGSKIGPADVETYTGISKDYNIFEFKSAVVTGDYAKALKIAEMFAQNPKEHPLLAIIPTLYGFFTTLYAYHTHPQKNDKRKLAADLKVNPYFLNEYYAAARRYPLRKVSDIIGVLRETDLAVKGYPGGQAGYRDMLHQMLFRIMH